MNTCPRMIIMLISEKHEVKIMKTISINVMNLCVPCENRCRYCLLSYDGKVSGADYKRSQEYAQGFYTWIQHNRPDLSFLFGFGYSMEHPQLIEAIRFCRSIGSATGEFLQFDGMRFRNEQELENLLTELKSNGIKQINFTFYGTEEYHDRFAARNGDFRLMTDTLALANRVGIDISVGIPLTHENACQADELLDALNKFRINHISCFVPHSEGRGKLLDNIRFTLEDYDKLSDRVKSLFNRNRFKSEQEWLLEENLPKPEKRVLTLTLTAENIDFFENMDFGETIAYLEELDDNYYRLIPEFEELMKLYSGKSSKMYSARDLYMCYQRMYIAEHNLDVYDINDERQCFSRRI